MSSAAVIRSRTPLPAHAALDRTSRDDDDLLAIRLTGDSDGSAIERDYTDDLEDLVRLSVAQHLHSKRSQPRLLVSAPTAPKSPSLYSSPRTPLQVSLPISATAHADTTGERHDESGQGWETLQSAADEATAHDNTAGGTFAAADEADRLAAASIRQSQPASTLPVPKRGQVIPRRLPASQTDRAFHERSAPARSVSQPAVRSPANREHVSQPASATLPSRRRIATDLPTQAPTPRLRTASQAPANGFGRHIAAATDTPPARAEVELHELTAARPPASKCPRLPPTCSTTSRTPSSSTARGGTAPRTPRQSTSRRSVSTSRPRTTHSTWASENADDTSPLPPWSDDAGPRIYRSSEGELVFAEAEQAPGGSMPRPQDRVLPAVAKRLEAERLKRLQGDRGQGGAWLVSEWGTAGDPMKAVRMASISTAKRERPSFASDDADLERDPSSANTPSDTATTEPATLVAKIADEPNASRPDSAMLKAEVSGQNMSKSSAAGTPADEADRHVADRERHTHSAAEKTARHQVSRLSSEHSPAATERRAPATRTETPSAQTGAPAGSEEAVDEPSPGCCTSCVIA
ncbi:hypothetical protein JCM10908_007001 [Rhodotorula pacifica]|uniref:uncharacterized protein n=1 Tax=Rhodotorula pacifica TaxID=1495444 RepID=UPI00316DB328